MTWMSVGQGPVSSCGCRIRFDFFTPFVLTWTDSQRNSPFLYDFWYKALTPARFPAWTTGMGKSASLKKDRVRIPRNYNPVHWRFRDQQVLYCLHPERLMSHYLKKHLFGCAGARWTCESTNVLDLCGESFPRLNVSAKTLTVCSLVLVRLCFPYSD